MYIAVSGKTADISGISIVGGGVIRDGGEEAFLGSFAGVKCCRLCAFASDNKSFDRRR